MYVYLRASLIRETMRHMYRKKKKRQKIKEPSLFLLFHAVNLIALSHNLNVCTSIALQRGKLLNKSRSFMVYQEILGCETLSNRDTHICRREQRNVIYQLYFKIELVCHIINVLSEKKIYFSKFNKGSAQKRNFDYCKILMASSILF